MIQPASSESRNATSRPTSSGSPIREIGIRERYSSRETGTSDRAAAIGVLTMPGSTEFTRMPRSPSSSAAQRVSMSSPAFETQ